MSAIFRHNISLTILVAFVVILISCPSIQTKDIVIYNSSVQDDSYQDIIATGSYADGTILFVIKGDDRDSLCLIRPNGTLEFISNTEIHCKPMNNSCDYYLLNPNFVVATYIENVGNNNGLGVATIIDWTGKVILRNIKSINVLRINEKNDRFLIMKHNNEFIEYHSYNNGTIINRTGSLHFNNTDKRHDIVDLFPFDNAWGILSTVKNQQYFFSIVQAQSKNKTLHVEKLEDLSDVRTCITTNNQTNDIQYYCLYITQYNHTLKLVNINNLSLNDNTFELNSTDLFPDIGFDTSTYIHVIPNIGFLVEATAYLKTKYYIFNISIDYFDSNNAFGELIINNNHNDDIGNNIFILPNKTIVRIIKKRNEIKFVQSDISSHIPKNNPYNNTHIKQVYPPNNELINVGTNTLNITFLNPIDPTVAAYISVYYDSGDELILRQKFLCTGSYCMMSKDNNSLTINLLNNTFNMPNASYYVEIDDNFFGYKYELITMPGIKLKNWIIKTSPENPYAKKDASSILGILRLNSTGTDKFQKLTDAEKEDFFNEMGTELAKSIPVDPSRFKISKYNKDETYMVSNGTTRLSTFSFQISPPNEDSFNKKSPIEVLEDLDSLIRSQDFTQLDGYSHTKYIDKDYGFQETSDLLEEINISLQNFNKKGNNIIVFKVALIIIDLINDIRFVITLKKILSNLFVPSVIFFSLPFILNIFLAVVIVKFEMQNSKNSEWFKHYIKPVAVATVLSSGDIELLHIFDSNFCGFKIFSANFSQKTLDLIFWGGFLNIILENLPQLVIQILYAINYFTIYDNTALFTLITSILVFLVSVIECSYHLFMNNNNGNHVGIQSDYNDKARDIK
ncbi:hypothetical protein RclHR1_03140016 [Rhizophagus clarus]|uniref:SbsA Ig-like domain-containing protein n=1 Tax=Rhizophagus clarus TaxID=94130 RepID=A0A2Z6R6U2_9GLOM|nr:hypothetical protein RclHR1_03140016 [Rhizophagus clarus]